MKMFNFLKKDIIVHCYTADAGVYNYSPIGKAIEFIPSWWKDLPKSLPPTDGSLNIYPTMKTCSGFTDLFSKGFVQPLWSDLLLEIGPQSEIGVDCYRYKFSDSKSSIQHHSVLQFNNYYPSTHYQHLKILSPWELVCDEDVDFLAISPTWTYDNPEKMIVHSGILNFKYQSGVNINIFWKREVEETTHHLSVGQPLLHYIPLSDRKIQLKMHLVSLEEMQKIRQQNASTKFLNKYKYNKKTLKQNGCPFHFKTEK